MTGTVISVGYVKAQLPIAQRPLSAWRRPRTLFGIGGKKRDSKELLYFAFDGAFR